MPDILSYSVTSVDVRQLMSKQNKEFQAELIKNIRKNTINHN